jgi:hypothetical protein
MAPKAVDTNRRKETRRGPAPSYYKTESNQGRRKGREEAANFAAFWTFPAGYSAAILIGPAVPQRILRLPVKSRENRFS